MRANGLDPMTDHDVTDRRKAERLEQQGDANVLAGEPAAAFYSDAQRILMPAGATWSDAEEYDLRMAAFQRLQEKLWALGPDGRLQSPAARHLFASGGGQQAVPTAKKPDASNGAYQTFLKSMEIGYDQWHDGVGYDLEALAKMGKRDRKAVTQLLVGRLASRADWRDIEALGALATPEATRAIKNALRSAKPEIRLHAAKQLADLDMAVDLDKVIAEVLMIGEHGKGLSLAIDLAAEHPTPLLRKTLLECALDGKPDVRVHAAALSLYLAGKADEPFDWNRRPFFLRFGEDDRKERLSAYKELCQRIDVKSDERR
jgi:hypothetical protein